LRKNEKETELKKGRRKRGDTERQTESVTTIQTDR
jgi:hypothetical protein